MTVHPKVAAAGLASWATTILVWILNLNGIGMPPEVAAAITGLLGFAAGWLVEDGPPLHDRVAERVRRDRRPIE